MVRCSRTSELSGGGAVRSRRRLTETYRAMGDLPAGMSKTVHDLRNEIRVAVGRFERVESTGFTKESLAAIYEAVGHDLPEGRLPPKGEMRAGIRREVGLAADDAEASGDAFRKADLQAIADALR